MPESVITPVTETTAPEAAAATAAVEGQAPAAEPTLEELQAELSTWKGHARTWEDRAKENKTAAEKLAELEKEKLTETERLQLELTELRAERERDGRALLLANVAAAKGVPAALLTGTTQEELEAAADALLAFRGTPKVPANDTSASGTQGTTINAGKQLTRADLQGMTTPEKLAARAEGRLNTLMGIK